MDTKRALMGLVLPAIIGASTAFAQQPTLDKLILTQRKGVGHWQDDTYYEAKPLNKQISGAVVFPSTYKNLRVTDVSGFGGCRAITSVIFSTNVGWIREDAFNGCKGLTSVNLPKSMYYIGDRAFANCPNLTSVNLPENGLRDGGGYGIGKRAFANCPNLTSVTIIYHWSDDFECYDVDFPADSFDGDLKIAFEANRTKAGGAQTYTRQAGGKHWTKQGSAKPARPEQTLPAKPRSLRR